MLDLAQFDTLDDALEKIAPRDRYLDVAKLIMPAPSERMPLTLATFFWFSMITRSEGLHGAIAREIREGNPHAVFPLIRAFAENVILMIYVNDHPRYISLLTMRPSELPKDGPRRKSIQSLINYATKHASGMKLVYAELSEATHFGAVAMWAAHDIVDEDDSIAETSWTSYPRWRSEEQALVACAHVLELADAMEILLSQFCKRHLLSAH
jgi:hypothetical protein